MDTSVRASVEPMNTALGGSSTIFLCASFVGLPLINQALAAENPLEGGAAFFVTVRSLIKVLGEIPAAAVLQALAVENAPPPSRPSPPQIPSQPIPGSPPAATCGAEMDNDDPGSQGITNMRVFGGGFLPGEGEVVDIIENGGVLASTNTDTFGSYSVTFGVLQGQFPIAHTVHAHGESSGRTSNNAGYTV